MAEGETDSRPHHVRLGGEALPGISGLLRQHHAPPGSGSGRELRAGRLSVESGDPGPERSAVPAFRKRRGFFHHGTRRAEKRGKRVPLFRECPSGDDSEFPVPFSPAWTGPAGESETVEICNHAIRLADLFGRAEYSQKCDCAGFDLSGGECGKGSGAEGAFAGTRPETCAPGRTEGPSLEAGRMDPPEKINKTPDQEQPLPQLRPPSIR